MTIISLKSVSILTSTQTRVAALAHEGFSNKEIAQKLGPTEGTVKQHLHKVFRKLEIRRRSALRQYLSPLIEA
jgi:two-component system, NarL family, nitrate/nitrite response regulator NarL